MGMEKEDLTNPTHLNSEGHLGASPCVSGEIGHSRDGGDIFRKATRPVVTVIFAATLAQVITQGIDIPGWAITLLSGVILWWFGDETIGRWKEKK
jgi:hypothetical protein